MFSGATQQLFLKAARAAALTIIALPLQAGAQEQTAAAPAPSSIFSPAKTTPGLLFAQNVRADDPARSVPSPNILPTDVTPLIFSGERRLLGRDLQFAVLKRLPERLWFSSATEVSQRFESNPLFDARHAVGDYVFRALPNVTVGYNVLKQTSVYCNYFVIKDVFARQNQLTFPTFQSLSLGFRHDIPIRNRVNVQLDFQARELWQTAHLRQADLLPAINVTGAVNPNIILFGSSLLQMRSANYFQGPTRELDPFYSIGLLLRKGKWTFSASNTFVTNYRRRDAIPPQGNVTMISDYELSCPISGAINNIVNAGSIMSSANLNLTAGGTITNALPASVTGPSPVMQAMQNLNVTSMTGSITNGGLMQAMLGTLNVQSALNSNLMINNTGGVLEALNSAINVRDANVLAKVDTSIFGGDILARELNLWTGDGTADVKVNDLTGQHHRRYRLCAGVHGSAQSRSDRVDRGSDVLQH